MGFPDIPLGERMHAFGVVLRGGPEPGSWRWMHFLHAVAAAIGMEAVDGAAEWTYPVNGKGGNGKTIVLPITESFLHLDTWPDHGGAYLFICSCRAFDSAVVDRVAREFSMEPAQDHARRFAAELNLK